MAIQMSEGDLAALGIAVDSTQVVQGTKALGDLQSQARLTGTEISNFQAKVTAALQAQYGMTEAQAKATQGLQAYSKETQNAAKGIQQISVALAELNTIKAQQAATNTQADIAAAFGIGAPLANSAKASASVFKDALKDINKTVDETGGKFRINTLAMREFFTIPRELASGNFNRIPGSLSLLAQGFGVLTPEIVGATLAIAAIAAPIVIMGVAFELGQKDVSDFNRAISTSGNYAGVTASQIDLMAHSISGEFNQGIRSVRGGLDQLVASGKFSSATIKVMTEDAVKWSQITGEKVSDILKSYEAAKGGIIKFAVAQEEAYHNITLAQLDYIQALEKSGQHEQAELQYFKDVQDNISNRALPAYGWLQVAMHDTATFASKMWDAILGIGRPETIDARISDTTTKINAIKARLASGTVIGAVTPEAKARGLALGRAALVAAEQDLRNLNLEQSATNAGTQLNAEYLQQQDNAIRAKYDNRAHRFPRGPKAPAAPANTDNINDTAVRFQDTTNAINLQAAAEQKLAAAYDISVAAGDQEKAHQEALAAVLKASQGPKGVNITLIDQQAREQAILNDINGKHLENVVKDTISQKAKNDLLQTQLDLLGKTNTEVLHSIALQEALAELKREGRDANSPEGRNRIAVGQAGADLQGTLNIGNQLGPNGAQNAESSAIKAAAELRAIDLNTYNSLTANRANYYAKIAQMRNADLISDRQATTLKAQYEVSVMQARLSNTQNFLTAVADLTSSSNKTLHTIGKAAAITEMSIEQGIAIMKAWASAPFPANIPAVAIVTAQTIAQIAKIQGLAEGGRVRGPGGPKDDMVPLWGSNGEYMMTAAATARYEPILAAMNRGNFGGIGLASGGRVGGGSGSIQTNTFDFSGANFGGTDPREVESRIDNLMKTKYGPAIVQQSVATSMRTQAQQSKRQKLNARTSG